ncbi:MAG: MotA/TolQ/ExbB proton channel family protein [Bdellovibrionia bacterium]
METWIVIVEWLARLILFILVALSVWSISIIIDRRKKLKELTTLAEDNQVWDLIKSHDLEAIKKISANSSLRGETLKICFDLKTSEQIDRGVSSFLQRKKKELETGLAVLGTLGSTTPFIGLLGTILGIIVAFGALSTGKIDSQKIMYALAEALILTAVGLAVAIPAVIAFNTFTKKLNAILKDCENLKDQYIAYILGK